MEPYSELLGEDGAESTTAAQPLTSHKRGTSRPDQHYCSVHCKKHVWQIQQKKDDFFLLMIQKKQNFFCTKCEDTKCKRQGKYSSNK